MKEKPARPMSFFEKVWCVLAVVFVVVAGIAVAISGVRDALDERARFSFEDGSAQAVIRARIEDPDFDLVAWLRGSEQHHVERLDAWSREHLTALWRFQQLVGDFHHSVEKAHEINGEEIERRIKKFGSVPQEYREAVAGYVRRILELREQFVSRHPAMTRQEALQAFVDGLKQERIFDNLIQSRQLLIQAARENVHRVLDELTKLKKA